MITSPYKVLPLTQNYFIAYSINQYIPKFVFIKKKQLSENLANFNSFNFIMKI